MRTEDLEVDESGTVNLIEQLDETNRKILNGLVQGVLQSQKENDRDKLQILTKQRKLIQQQAMIEKTKLVAQRQKLDLMKVTSKQRDMERQVTAELKEIKDLLRTQTPDTRQRNPSSGAVSSG